jgi:hypothetical protein
MGRARTAKGKAARGRVCIIDEDMTRLKCHARNQIGGTVCEVDSGVRRHELGSSGRHAVAGSEGQVTQ